MKDWFKAHPRFSGAVLVGASPVVAGLNFFVMAVADRWYPVLFPAAAIFFFFGLLQVITGAAPETLREAPLWYRIVGFLGLVTALVAGLGANYLWVGSLL